MDADWCKLVLEEAIEMHGTPEIINSVQGYQFTSEIFSGYVLRAGGKLNMDGKGRAIDSAFIERLWRCVNYEKLNLNPPNNGTDLTCT